MKDFFANHKKACVITASAAAVLLVAVLILSLALGKGKPETADNTSDISSSDSSSSINIEDPENDAVSSEVLPDTDNYISPDESEADKILSENTANTSKQEAVQKPQEEVKKEESVSVATIQEPAAGADPNPIQTYEESKKAHEKEVEDYLKANGIDPATAGETGELCPGCGKKIWDPNKYGLNNPGDLDNYENSGYCTGWCTVQVG